MKKIALLCASVLAAFGGFAYAQDVPNRVIVNSNSGNSQGYVIEDIRDISFARVEGEVAAKVVVNDVALDKLGLDITMTEGCRSFQLGVFPATIASQMKTAAGASARFSRGSYETYYQDFTGAELSGLELKAGGEYAVVTLAYDMYGTPCHSEVVEFDTPAPEIVGNPDVEVTVTDRTKYSFTANFKPNADCLGYYCVAAEKGVLEQQYESFGPMFGFVNMNEMIVQWGLSRDSEESNTWKDMAPNTDYEIYIAMMDANGNFAPYKVVETSTLSLGGSGAAYVDIELGDYKLNDWNGEMLPSQFVTYKPNDQASCYRFGVYLEDEFNADKQGIIDDLCTDPMMPTANWFFYETLSTDYQINPNTNFVVIAAAKNADGEWGEVNEKHFTTPASVQGAPAKMPATKSLRSRSLKKQNVRGTVPAQLSTGKLTVKK